jgi:hypothetical protein
MTAVHVYRDEPRCFAISLAATISRTMIQKLDTNTVALGTSRARASGFLLFMLAVFIESIIYTDSRQGQRKTSIGKLHPQLGLIELCVRWEKAKYIPIEDPKWRFKAQNRQNQHNFWQSSLATLLMLPKKVREYLRKSS